MRANISDVKFRVHEIRMSDNTISYIPEGGFSTLDGGRTWVRLCLGDFPTMKGAEDHIETFKEKHVVIPVENIFHEVE